MKTITILTALLLLWSCSMQNKVTRSEDPYRKTTTLVMFQTVRCYPDHPRYLIRYFNLNRADLELNYIRAADGTSRMFLTLGIETGIREDPMEPELYVRAGGKNFQLKPVSSRYENFTRNSTETSVTTTSSPGSEKEGKKKEPSTAVSSTTSSTSAPGRYNNLKFSVSDELKEVLVNEDKPVIRFYFGDEGWQCSCRHRQARSLNRFMKSSFAK